MSEPIKDNNASQSAASRTKELRITGPMTANIVALISSISRIENRVINMSMAQSLEVRSKANAISERFQRAVRMFEEELRSLNKDSDADSRPSRRGDQRQTNGPAKVAGQPKSPSQQSTTVTTAAASPNRKNPRGSKRRKGQGAQLPADQVSAATAAPAVPSSAPAPANPGSVGKAAATKNAAVKPAAKPQASVARSEEPAKKTPPAADQQKGQATPVPAPAI